MEDRGTQAYETGGGEHDVVGGSQGEEHEANQRDAHAGGERIGFRVSIGVETNERLEYRTHHLKRQGDQADLSEVEMEGILEQGVDGRNQGLDGIVKQVRETEREQDSECGRFGTWDCRRRGAACWCVWLGGAHWCVEKQKALLPFGSRALRK